MKRTFSLFLSLAATLSLTGCRSPVICPWCGKDVRTRPPAADSASLLPAGEVSGTVTTMERGELHPLARLEVSLLDVTLGDGTQPSVVASKSFDHIRRIPLSFRIPYGDGAIDESHEYVLSARIVVVSDVLFETDTRYPVLTHGAPKQAQLVLVRTKTP